MNRPALTVALRAPLTAIVLTLAASPIRAHTVPGEHTGVLHRFLHLIGGADHVPPLLGIVLCIGIAAICLGYRHLPPLVRFSGAAVSAIVAVSLLAVVIS